MLKYTQTSKSYKLAYHQHEGNGPGIVFLGGLRSDMTGTKAMALQDWCKEKGQAFLRFDYYGHGASDGKFEDGRIGMWHEDVLHMLDTHTDGTQIVVGSSMGGWQMLLAAIARPEKIVGLVGIASAPDFTRELMWDQLSAQQQATLKETGTIEVPSDYSDEPYLISYDFITESDKWHLLNKECIDISCPVTLLHGMADKDVPWQYSTRIAEKLKSTDVDVRLIKHADHRFSSPPNISILLEAIENIGHCY